MVQRSVCREKERESGAKFVRMTMVGNERPPLINTCVVVGDPHTGLAGDINRNLKVSVGEYHHFKLEKA